MEIGKKVANISVMKKLPELLAPAGTLDAFKTAILYGADAIYAGLPGFLCVHVQKLQRMK